MPKKHEKVVIDEPSLSVPVHVATDEEIEEKTKKLKIVSTKKKYSDTIGNIINHKTQQDNRSVPVKVTYTIIPSEQRTMRNILTRAEYTRVLSVRSTHIENSAKVFVDTTGLTTSIDIARKEIIEKKCPLSILRLICNDENGNCIYEKWHVNELTLFDSIAVS